jgi:hypothetical protein
MNNRKSIDDYSPSYLAKAHWSKLFREKTFLVGSSPATVSAQLCYFLLQPFFKEGRGFLTSDLRTVATQYPRHYGQNVAKLSDDIARLVRVDLLRMDENGLVFDPVMAAEISQDFPKSSKILEQTSKIRTFPPREESNQKSTVEYSRVVVAGAAQRASLATTTTVTETEQKKEARGGAALPLVPFSGLTETDLGKVREEFPNHDFESVYAKFVKWHTKKGTAGVRLKDLRGWFNREKQVSAVVVENEQGGINAKIAEARERKRIDSLPTFIFNRDSEGNRTHGATAGGKKISEAAIRQFKLMPLMTLNNAHWYLCDLTKCEWNTNAFIKKHDISTLDEIGDDDMFYSEEDGRVRGAEFETDEELEQHRIEEEECEHEKAAIAEQAKAALAEQERQRLNPTF